MIGVWYLNRPASAGISMQPQGRSRLRVAVGSPKMEGILKLAENENQSAHDLNLLAL